MSKRSRFVALTTVLSSLLIAAPASGGKPLDQVTVDGVSLGDDTFGGRADCAPGQHVVSGGYVTEEGQTATLNHAIDKERAWVAVAVGVNAIQVTANCSDDLNPTEVTGDDTAGRTRLGKPKAKCPRGKSVVSGGWEYAVDDENSPVYSSAPTSGRTWGLVAASDGRDTIRAFGYCLKVDVKQRTGRNKRVAPGADQTAKANCKRANDLLGGGFLTSPKPDWLNTDGPDPFFSATTRVGAPWLVRAHNFSSVSGKIKAVATCLD